MKLSLTIHTMKYDNNKLSLTMNYSYDTFSNNKLSLTMNYIHINMIITVLSDIATQ